MRALPRVVTAVILVSAAVPVAAQDRATDQALKAVYARFSQAYKEADAEKVANLYTEDAYYLQPNSEVIQGRDSVLALFQRMLDPIRQQQKPGPAIYFDILERKMSGSLGWDVGYYRIGPPGADSASSKRGGKFIVLWRKDRDGQWRIHADGYSGLTPPQRP